MSPAVHDVEDGSHSCKKRKNLIQPFTTIRFCGISKTAAGEGILTPAAEDWDSSWHKLPIFLRAGTYSHSGPAQQQREDRRPRTACGQPPKLQAPCPEGPEGVLGAGRSHTQSTGWVRTRSAPGPGSWRPGGWGVGRPGPALWEHTAPSRALSPGKRTIATTCTAGQTATLGAPGPKIQAGMELQNQMRSRLNPEGENSPRRVKNRVRSAECHT